ncbi:uncharacterized protein LOC26528647 [Drosophila mojavensis]|uniref:Uncharacterized protein, isoform B n=1 Tax=Drosophila mojavensis TaxID=7230 RepID=A0A0Q9XCT3_DROMO|nr:uncharacterized protein LOC26528647 [Drosophila mojavensis]KRG05465.1 uncharacterized protein Dmoj_GI27006, isoform B [Drosophila mojavensis]
MVKMTNYFPIILFGIISFLTESDAGNVSNNECVNCSAYSGSCEVNRTGWAPFKMSLFDSEIVRPITTFEIADSDTKLAGCVIDGYTITDEVDTFICFWAPYFGCQTVASKDYVNIHHFHRIACQQCFKYCRCTTQTNSAIRKSLIQFVHFCIFFVCYYTI